MSFLSCVVSFWRPKREDSQTKIVLNSWRDYSGSAPKHHPGHQRVHHRADHVAPFDTSAHHFTPSLDLSLTHTHTHTHTHTLQFFEAIFRLVDTWTEAVDAKMYLGFLKQLFGNLTTTGSNGGRRILRRDSQVISMVDAAALLAQAGANDSGSDSSSSSDDDDENAGRATMPAMFRLKATIRKAQIDARRMTMTQGEGSGLNAIVSRLSQRGVPKEEPLPALPTPAEAMVILMKAKAEEAAAAALVAAEKAAKAAAAAEAAALVRANTEVWWDRLYGKGQWWERALARKPYVPPANRRRRPRKQFTPTPVPVAFDIFVLSVPARKLSVMHVQDDAVVARCEMPFDDIDAVSQHSLGPGRVVLRREDGWWSVVNRAVWNQFLAKMQNADPAMADSIVGMVSSYDGNPALSSRTRELARRGRRSGGTPLTNASLERAQSAPALKLRPSSAPSKRSRSKSRSQAALTASPLRRVTRNFWTDEQPGSSSSSSSSSSSGGIPQTEQHRVRGENQDDSQRTLSSTIAGSPVRAARSLAARGAESGALEEGSSDGSDMRSCLPHEEYAEHAPIGGYAFGLPATHELQGPEFEDNLLRFANTTQSLRRHINSRLLDEDLCASGSDKHASARSKRLAVGLRSRARVPKLKRRGGMHDHQKFFGKARQRNRPTQPAVAPLPFEARLKRDQTRSTAKLGGLPTYRHPVLRQRPRSAVPRSSASRRNRRKGDSEFELDEIVLGAGDQNEYRGAGTGEQYADEDDFKCSVVSPETSTHRGRGFGSRAIEQNESRRPQSAQLQRRRQRYSAPPSWASP